MVPSNKKLTIAHLTHKCSMHNSFDVKWNECTNACQCSGILVRHAPVCWQTQTEGNETFLQVQPPQQFSARGAPRYLGDTLWCASQVQILGLLTNGAQGGGCHFVSCKGVSHSMPTTSHVRSANSYRCTPLSPCLDPPRHPATS